MTISAFHAVDLLSFRKKKLAIVGVQVQYAHAPICKTQYSNPPRTAPVRVSDSFDVGIRQGAVVVQGREADVELRAKLFQVCAPAGRGTARVAQQNRQLRQILQDRLCRLFKLDNELQGR